MSHLCCRGQAAGAPAESSGRPAASRSRLALSTAAGGDNSVSSPPKPGIEVGMPGGCEAAPSDKENRADGTLAPGSNTDGAGLQGEAVGAANQCPAQQQDASAGPSQSAATRKRKAPATAAAGAAAVAAQRPAVSLQLATSPPAKVAAGQLLSVRLVCGPSEVVAAAGDVIANGHLEQPAATVGGQPGMVVSELVEQSEGPVHGQPGQAAALPPGLTEADLDSLAPQRVSRRIK